MDTAVEPHVSEGRRNEKDSVSCLFAQRHGGTSVRHFKAPYNVGNNYVIILLPLVNHDVTWKLKD